MKEADQVTHQGANAPVDKATERVLMASVRARIDAIDDELMALLVARQACIDEAVTIKRGRGIPARVPERVDEVINNACARAVRAGFDEGLVRDIWTMMVNWSIAREERTLGPSVPQDRL